jgi:hypothetical protein
MPKTKPEKNKAFVLKAFDTLFNKRDYPAAERFWSPDYVQHSAHTAPANVEVRTGTIVAEGDFVIVHGRFSGFDAPVNWIAADIVPHSKRNPSRALGRHSRMKRRKNSR